MRWIYAGAVALVLFATQLAGTAQAACTCQCVNGQMQALCTSSIELPPLCPPTPPSIAPIGTPTLPPLGTTSCGPRQVLNPYTRQYEWRTICQ
jgi:hypothetical protein